MMKRIVACLFWAGVVISVTPSTGALAEKPNTCTDQLKTLGNACLQYAKDNNGQMPPSLAELYYQAYVNDLETFVCRPDADAILSRTEIDAKSSFALVSEAEPSAAIPVLKDRSVDNHQGAGINVFYNHGRVRWQAVSSMSGTSEISPKAASSSLYLAPSAEDRTRETRDDQKADIPPVEIKEVKTPEEATYQPADVASPKAEQSVDVYASIRWGVPFYIDMETRLKDRGILTSKKELLLESGTYRLEFDIVGDPLKGPFPISFRVGTIFEDKIILGAKEMVKSVSRKIDVQGPAPLRVRLFFHHEGGNFSDVMLDNVRLRKLTRGK